MYKYFLVALMLAALASCKKDGNTVSGLQKRMIGRWYIDKVSIDTYSTNHTLEAHQEATGDAGNFIEFKNDNTMMSASNASSQVYTSSFQTTSENTFTTTQGTITDTCRVINLQDKSFTFITNRGRKTNTFYVEFTYSLKK